MRKNKEDDRAYQRRWAAANKEKVRDAQRKWRTAHPEKKLWRAARNRAKQDGLSFTITPDDIVIPDVCPVLGLPLAIATGKSGPNSPSLDRIAPHVGYVPENIEVISWRANSLKKDATPDELRKLADYYQKRQQHEATRPELEFGDAEAT